VVVALGVLVALMVAAVATTIVIAQRGSQTSTDTTLTADSAKAAIQEYLDALTQGKDEVIAEHASCGLFDAVKDKQSDMALANLASETFRRQFSSADVTTVDKIVNLSPNQAQVLFSMDAKSAGRSQSPVERQAVAQLLIQGDQILVCSYLPRNAGPF
jgi:Tfp pilus assembly protein PilX